MFIIWRLKVHTTGLVKSSMGTEVTGGVVLAFAGTSTCSNVEWPMYQVSIEKNTLRQ